MDEQNMHQRPRHPQRRTRSKLQIIKEDYLPVIIIGIALILIIWFVIGSIVRGVQKKRYENNIKQQALITEQQQQAAIEAEASALLAEAAILAEEFDYNGALDVLDRFTGDMYAHKEFSDKYTEYAKAAASLVLWEDPSQVTNLSFHPLVADADRAFTDSFYAENYITTTEFTKILQQLYENGYMLVRYSDLIAKDGKMQLYLPKGKKPLIITETQVNYNEVLVNKGFASKLVLDSSGNLTCEMIDKDGKTQTGAYDIVPILENFIKSHRDFSYKGARAVLALTGVEGVFGYRTAPTYSDYTQQTEAAKKVIAAVKAAGYELACYSYENKAYDSRSPEQIKAELELWKKEVTPLLGEISLFVMCKGSDIAPKGSAYSGAKFQVLKTYGFTDFIGFSDDGKNWFNSYADHNRMGRIMITGANLSSHASWFEGIFDAYAIKDRLRN